MHTKYIYLIYINQDVNDQLSGLRPLINFKKSSNIHYDIWVHFIFIWVNILLYFISFILKKLRTRGNGDLKGPRELPTKAWVSSVSLWSPFFPLLFNIFFANNQVILTQIQHK